MQKHSPLRDIVIAGRHINGNAQPYMLAEMACAHDGQFERAIRMVNDAADAGFDGIQFQLFSTENLLTPRHPFYDKVKGLEISYLDWARVFKVARTRGLNIFVNPLSIDALIQVRNLGADALKIHSADLSNPDMLRALAEFRLPVSVAVGGSTIAEIENALMLLSAEGILDVLLMHGFQGYPTVIEDTKLDCIPYLAESFGLHIGYMDHIDGSDELALILPAIAAAMGAVLLEKHITDDRARGGTDFESALDREGQGRFVRLIRDAHRARGVCRKDVPSVAEIKYRKTFKKSIVAARDVAANETFGEEMVIFMRGETLGLAPNDLSKVLGKKAAKAIAKYDVIKADDLTS